MPRRGGRHYVLVKGAEAAMDAFKLEVAMDLGLGHMIDEDGTYKKMTTVQVGQIGGEMVRRIQAAGELMIMQRHAQGAFRLVPDEILPAKNKVRSVSNNGNPTPHAQFNNAEHTMVTENTGQSWEPGNNEMTELLNQPH